MTDTHRIIATGRYRAILLIGPPGSGKSTQGRILGEVPGHYFISMGEVLRSLEPGTEREAEIQRYLQNGDLIPSELAVSLWTDHMSKQAAAKFDPHHDRLVLDGLPRNIEQARMLQSYLHVESIIHFGCESHAELAERIRKRNDDREDDTDEQVMRHRFELYRQQSLPLLEWYDSNAISTVNAGRKPLEVLGAIVDALITR